MVVQNGTTQKNYSQLLFYQLGIANIIRKKIIFLSLVFLLIRDNPADCVFADR